MATIDLGVGTDLSVALAAVGPAGDSPAEAHFAWRGSRACVPRLRRATRQPSRAGREPGLSGAQWVTGGLGGLGLRAAALLVECGAATVCLSSRRGAPLSLERRQNSEGGARAGHTASGAQGMVQRRGAAVDLVVGRSPIIIIIGLRPTLTPTTTITTPQQLQQHIYIFIDHSLIYRLNNQVSY